MGIIKAVTTAVGGALADQWLEAVEPDDMGDRTVFVRGVQVRRERGLIQRGHLISCQTVPSSMCIPTSL